MREMYPRENVCDARAERWNYAVGVEIFDVETVNILIDIRK